MCPRSMDNRLLGLELNDRHLFWCHKAPWWSQELLKPKWVVKPNLIRKTMRKSYMLGNNDKNHQWLITKCYLEYGHHYNKRHWSWQTLLKSRSQRVAKQLDIFHSMNRFATCPEFGNLSLKSKLLLSIHCENVLCHKKKYDVIFCQGSLRGWPE